MPDFITDLSFTDAYKLNLSGTQLTLKQMSRHVSTYNQAQVCYLYCPLTIHFSLLFLSVPTKKLHGSNHSSVNIHFPVPLRAQEHTDTYGDHDADIHPGWRLIPVADESRHDGSEACNVIYRAGLTFQIQSGTLITDENLRQEIALIAN